MRNLKTYEEFLNESMYDDTFIPEIKYAKMTKNMFSLRKIMGHITGVSDTTEIENMPEKEVTKFINKYVKDTKFEKQHEKTLDKISVELERLHRSDSITINAHANCPYDLQLQFIRPIFYGLTKPKEVLAFLKDSDSVTIKAFPKVVNKWRVEYEGTVGNGSDISFDFKNVDNGLAVNLG